MKRYVFILISILILLSVSHSPTYAHAGHDHNLLAQGSSTDSALIENAASPSAEESVQYELPYPGMLPDSPLYFLKTLRDAVVKFLISDSLKKAEFNILTADKRAYAALLLAEKDKYELSLETLSKSNNYLHDALSSLLAAQKDKKDISSLHGQLKTSVKKHKEVFSRQIEPQFPENMKKDLNREIKRLETIEKSVNALKQK